MWTMVSDMDFPMDRFYYMESIIFVLLIVLLYPLIWDVSYDLWSLLWDISSIHLFTICICSMWSNIFPHIVDDTTFSLYTIYTSYYISIHMFTNIYHIWNMIWLCYSISRIWLSYLFYYYILSYYYLIWHKPYSIPHRPYGILPTTIFPHMGYDTDIFLTPYSVYTCLLIWLQCTTIDTLSTIWSTLQSPLYGTMWVYCRP